MPGVTLEPPSELHFRRPFEHVVTAELSLTNTNSYDVQYKVKTTAPKRYCVRPNAGLIEAHQSVKVLILLQPMKDPGPDFKCKDKFLVQTIKASSDSSEDQWAKAQKDAISESKLRCFFLPPAEEARYEGLSAPERAPVASKTAAAAAAPAPAAAAAPTPTLAPAATTGESKGKGKEENNEQMQAQMKKQKEEAAAKIQELTKELNKAKMENSRLAGTKASKDKPVGFPLVYLIAAFILGILVSQFVLSQ